MQPLPLHGFTANSGTLSGSGHPPAVKRRRLLDPTESLVVHEKVAKLAVPALSEADSSSLVLEPVTKGWTASKLVLEGSRAAASSSSADCLDFEAKGQKTALMAIAGGGASAAQSSLLTKTYPGPLSGPPVSPPRRVASGGAGTGSPLHASGGAGYGSVIHSPHGSPARVSFFSKSSAAKSLKTPARDKVNLKGPFVEAALKIHDEGFISKDAARFKITAIPGAVGEHSQIYNVLGSVNILAGTANADIVVKLFQEDVIRENGGPRINTFVRTALTQYDELKSTSLPIVQIYNRDTVMTDGYLIVERVTPLKMPWDESTDLDSIKAMHMPVLTQIKAFFDYADKSESKIPLDLNEGNFGFNKAGVVVLLDFMEHDENDNDTVGPGAAFAYIKPSCVRKVANGNAHVERFLNGEAI